MIPELLCAFFAGAVTHKAWRAAWRTRRHPVGWRTAIIDEFAPPDHDTADRARARVPKPHQIA